ncbi:MAG: hypothetical protein COX80_05080 [Candidatus Magasanikbacteria bacterium CG_4_10_14_0_2_um_filter_33_14]|uniref:Uncharacterized protein n=1 Tax=Candidatus Magasanikbacteria bacterium CG_4_10_14_0_2_um_filter_33_14 TaxID=1974636 RepID=A0A2M7V8F1_9BACT|nr:MAG: hypothetical protein COX80_05080 [Candidatus Magasanikbacteria bacterium CG_4_10_14_0_2_um_filter_33_14]
MNIKMSVMKKEKYEGYIDTSGDFSNASLKRAEFFLKHKILFRNIITGILIAWCIFSILFSLFFIGKYFIFDYERDRLNSIQMVNVGVSKAVIQRNQPQQIGVGQGQVFQSSKDKYDFGVEISNPNEAWIASVDYHVVYSGGQTENKNEIFLPGEKRYLVEFGISSSGENRPTGLELKIDNVSWNRVDAHDFPNPIDYIAQRKSFSLENINFEAFGGNDIFIGKLLSFDLINNTLFGYKEARFVIVLRNYGNVVGFMPLYISDFSALSTQNIKFSLFNNNLSVDEVEVQPVLNVFDDNIYMSL